MFARRIARPEGAWFSQPWATPRGTVRARVRFAAQRANDSPGTRGEPLARWAAGAFHGPPAPLGVAQGWENCRAFGPFPRNCFRAGRHSPLAETLAAHPFPPDERTILGATQPAWPPGLTETASVSPGVVDFWLGEVLLYAGLTETASVSPGVVDFWLGEVLLYAGLTETASVSPGGHAGPSLSRRERGRRSTRRPPGCAARPRAGSRPRPRRRAGGRRAACGPCPRPAVCR